jgi:hypothetical protein
MAPHALLAQRILDNDWTSPCVCLSTNLSPDQKFQTRFVCLNCEFWCNPRRDICISSRTLLAWCRKERGAARVVQFASMHAFLSSSDRGSFKVSAKQKQIYVRTCTAVRPYSTPVQETARVFGSAGNGTVRRHPNPNAPFGLVERTSPFVTGSCPPPPAWRSHRLVPSETVGRRRLRACRLNTYGAVWFAGWSSPDQSDGRAELIPRIKLQGNCFDAGRCHSVNQYANDSVGSDVGSRMAPQWVRDAIQTHSLNQMCPGHHPVLLGMIPCRMLRCPSWSFRGPNTLNFLIDRLFKQIHNQISMSDHSHVNNQKKSTYYKK